MRSYSMLSRWVSDAIPMDLKANHCLQRRNPVRQSVKNVGMEIGDIAADFQVGTHNGVLFLRSALPSALSLMYEMVS